MKARAKWIEGRAFLGESGSGHAVIMDGAPEAGGRNLGVRPMEFLLVGMAGCTAFDVVHILEKGREPVTGCEVEAEASRATEEPKVFTGVHVKYKVTGKGLSRDKVERAVALSHEKYCSASVMFVRSGAKLTKEIEVIDD
jgi:putative redox protein